MNLYTVSFDEDEGKVRVEEGLEVIAAGFPIFGKTFPFQHVRLGGKEPGDPYKIIPLGSRDFSEPVSRLTVASLIPLKGRVDRDGRDRLMFIGHKKGAWQSSSALIRLVGFHNWTSVDYKRVPCGYRGLHDVIAEVEKRSNCNQCGQSYTHGYFHPDAGEMKVYAPYHEKDRATYLAHTDFEVLLQLSAYATLRITHGCKGLQDTEYYLSWDGVNKLNHGSRSHVLGARGPLKCKYSAGMATPCWHCDGLVPVRNTHNLAPLLVSTCPECGIEYKIKFE